MEQEQQLEIIQQQVTVTIACDDFTTQAECPSGAPGTACNWNGQTCIENPNLRAAGGGFGFGFDSNPLGLNYMTAEEALQAAKIPALGAGEKDIERIATFFTKTFNALFKAIFFNIRNLAVELREMALRVSYNEAVETEKYNSLQAELEIVIKYLQNVAPQATFKMQ